MSEGQDGLVTDRHGEPMGEPLLLFVWLIFLAGVLYPAVGICALVLAAGLGNALGAEPPYPNAATAVWLALLASAAVIGLFWLRGRSARRRGRPLRTATVMLVLGLPVATVSWIVVAVLSSSSGARQPVRRRCRDRRRSCPGRSPPRVQPGVRGCARDPPGKMNGEGPSNETLARLARCGPTRESRLRSGQRVAELRAPSAEVSGRQHGAHRGAQHRVK